MKVRTRERRDLLTSVRASILRTAFLAEGVLAINASLFLSAFQRAFQHRYQIEGEGHRAKIYSDGPRAISLLRAYRSALQPRQCGFSRSGRLNPVKDGL